LPLSAHNAASCVQIKRDDPRVPVYNNSSCVTYLVRRADARTVTAHSSVRCTKSTAQSSQRRPHKRRRQRISAPGCTTVSPACGSRGPSRPGADAVGTPRVSTTRAVRALGSTRRGAARRRRRPSLACNTRRALRAVQTRADGVRAAAHVCRSHGERPRPVASRRRTRRRAHRPRWATSLAAACRASAAPAAPRRHTATHPARQLRQRARACRRRRQSRARRAATRHGRSGAWRDARPCAPPIRRPPRATTRR
jgi:hypothetical protein